MASNPNPARISAAAWSFWTAFDAFDPTVLLGGFYADKAGYHNYRDDLPGTDYSRRDVAADRNGSGALCSAVDLSLPSARMKTYSARLKAACVARDARLFLNGQAIIREFIGTLDGSSVYCYVLTGGKALGVGADYGPDPGRDTSHLWHIHISVIRQFAASAEAWNRILSILKGESAEAYFARSTTQETDVNLDDLIGKGLTDNDSRTVRKILADVANLRNVLYGKPNTAKVGKPDAGSLLELLQAMAVDWPAEAKRQQLRDEALLAAVKGDADTQTITTRIDVKAAEIIAEGKKDAAAVAEALVGPLTIALQENLASIPAEALQAAAETAIRRVLGQLDAAQ